MKKVVLTFFFLFSFLIISSAQTVYITKTGSKYHTSDCSSLRNSSILIKLKDAIDRGYTACSKCSPPLTIKTDEVKKANVESKNNSDIQQPVVEKKKEVSGSGRCQAITKKGMQCKRKAQAGSNYCWQHSK